MAKGIRPQGKETDIWRANALGYLEEVPQNNIDFWCNLCQFPLNPSGKCTDTAMIQACWSETSATAGVWHIFHECPFTHQNQECRCNDYKTIEEAFKATGLDCRKDSS